ncbi:AMP-binding protein [Kitasatospora sp. NPDC059160]|uniref:AMP-binding protein n=1 Tax=Kitasatospora sp. NPDC059160 TaxID=3346748 RepID=UPI0036AD0A78
MSNIHGFPRVAPDLLDVLRDIARRNPRRPAIVHRGPAPTHGRLLESANSLATGPGSNPGTVAVRAVHAPETVVALLGMPTAGGHCRPVDPVFPPARRQTVAAAAQCRTTVSVSTGESLQLAIRLVESPEPTAEPSKNPGDPPALPSTVAPEQPARIPSTLHDGFDRAAETRPDFPSGRPNRRRNPHPGRPGPTHRGHRRSEGHLELHAPTG